MRVLLALYRDDASVGGSLRVGQVLAKGLQNLGITTRLVFAYGGEGATGEGKGIPTSYLGLKRPSNIVHWLRARRLVADFQPDIVHFIDPLIWMHVSLTGTKPKRVSHFHGALIRPTLSKKILLQWRLIQSRDNAFVCITEGSRRSVIRRLHAPEGKTSVVYNGVDFGWFQQRPSKAEARSYLGLPPNAFVVGGVGRLFRSRCYDDLLRILSLLDSNWRVLLAGGGPERKKLEQLAYALGVSERTTFTGPLPDVRVAYSAMDAFAFLPLYDSFGLATAEAMACRVPVFGIDCPGEYREPQNPLITDDNAIFLPHRSRKTYEDNEDPALLRAFAEKLTAFGEDPAKLAPMIDRAWEHVRSRFSTDAQAKAMLEVYEKVLSQNAEGSQTVHATSSGTR